MILRGVASAGGSCDISCDVGHPLGLLGVLWDEAWLTRGSVG